MLPKCYCMDSWLKIKIKSNVTDGQYKVLGCKSHNWQPVSGG